MIKFRQKKTESKPKAPEELKEKIEERSDLNRAYRISKEMRALAGDLITKAEQLERELEA